MDRAIQYIQKNMSETYKFTLDAVAIKKNNKYIRVKTSKPGFLPDIVAFHIQRSFKQGSYLDFAYFLFY